MEARRLIRARLPRLLASAVAFYVVFTVMLSRHRTLGGALLAALIWEAIFVVAVFIFVGGIVLLMMKTRPPDR